MIDALTPIFRLGLTAALLVVLPSASPVHSTPGTDPRVEPIPSLDLGQGSKAIVVRLTFNGRDHVTVSSVQVSLGRALTHVGDPPLLRIEVFDKKDALVSQFNDWHPLWADLYRADGTHGRHTLAEASGRIVIPFAPNLKTMKVIDIADPNKPELITVDLRPAIRDYCQANPRDTDCPLGPATLWVGLKNSDDQGTQFDVQVRVYKSLTDPVDQPVATGLIQCVTGTTRDPNKARQLTIEFDTHVVGPYAMRVFTRVGTTETGAKCPGPGGSHHNALGLRMYFDSTSRPSRIGTPSFHLHSSTVGNFLDLIVPSTAVTKHRDSAHINFAGGNAWREIGTGWAQ